MRLRGLLLLTAVVLMGCVATAGASALSSVELIEHPAEWDGRVIVFTGEAVGEAMVRGEEAWLHLNDDAYVDGSIAGGAEPQGYNSGMAVVADAEDAAAITVFGDYRHQGDVVEVSGVFNAACPEHGGDMDIHATGLRIVREGAPVTRLVDYTRVVALGITLAAAILAVLWYTARSSRD
ncbi:hypothetical protein [Anaerosoma tenue]|uniref:hypothetical protein n=1 Tax=Anaerosoma tenue TaxID=2933588 RepID=UPI002261023A|nr:hypothetical protein [Anaerosoma tenue]MCK8115810.1 hypothetical protein [Anaerosoma tenue]